MYPKIIGFDESGRTGNNQIFFCQVEFNEENEADLFINNIVEAKDFLFKKTELSGWDKKKKIRVCHNILKKNLIKIKFYKLNPIEQNKILHDIFKYQASFLFDERDKLIEIYKREKETRELSPLIAQLYHYRNPSYLPEFTIKSYAYLYILTRMCMVEKTYNFLQNEDYIIKAQIDGGNIFTFWWFEFLHNHDKKDLLENKLFINGIPKGDQYYLSMNLAGLFSSTFSEAPHSFFNFPIEDIKYNFNDINFPEDFFYERIWYYLKNFHFKKRLLFIGNSELFMLIPHLLHFKKRSIIYEPFIIKDDIKDYFRYFKIGPPEKNLIVFSHNLKRQDKLNIKYCRDLGIETKSVDEFNEDY